MSKFICSVLLLALCSVAFSQKVYFIYLQSEADQPFFVKINEKTYNSVSAGYLLLSNLKDSSHNFKVGFPQNNWPDQQFSITIKSKDRGYLLKNFGEKGWGLFDLQTMSVQMSENGTREKASKTESKEVSAFTETLSRAANDPSLKEKPVFAVVKKEEKTETVQPAVVKTEKIVPKEEPVSETLAQIKKDEKSESIQPAVGTEEQIVLKEQPAGNTGTQLKKEDPPIVREEIEKKEVSPAGVTRDENVSQKEKIKTSPVQEYKRSVVVKRSESSTTDGFGLTFVDQYADGQKDTIQIIIPNSNTLIAETRDEPTGEKKFLDITESSVESKPTTGSGTKKTSCSSSASENDFLKLRKKMAGQKTEEAMINEAKKAFAAKCFNTVQIKNLGNLFLNEASKFQFYEAAYPFSSDRDNFAVLQGELKENYFIHRFKNLVKTSN